MDSPAARKLIRAWQCEVISKLSAVQELTVQNLALFHPYLDILHGEQAVLQDDWAADRGAFTGNVYDVARVCLRADYAVLEGRPGAPCSFEVRRVNLTTLLRSVERAAWRDWDPHGATTPPVFLRLAAAVKHGTCRHRSASRQMALERGVDKAFFDDFRVHTGPVARSRLLAHHVGGSGSAAAARAVLARRASTSSAEPPAAKRAKSGGLDDSADFEAADDDEEEEDDDGASVRSAASTVSTSPTQTWGDVCSNARHKLEQVRCRSNAAVAELLTNLRAAVDSDMAHALSVSPTARTDDGFSLSSSDDGDDDEPRENDNANAVAASSSVAGKRKLAPAEPPPPPPLALTPPPRPPPPPPPSPQQESASRDTESAAPHRFEEEEEEEDDADDDTDSVELERMLRADLKPVAPHADAIRTHLRGRQLLRGADTATPAGARAAVKAAELYGRALGLANACGIEIRGQRDSDVVALRNMSVALQRKLELADTHAERLQSGRSLPADADEVEIDMDDLVAWLEAFARVVDKRAAAADAARLLRAQQSAHFEHDALLFLQQEIGAGLAAI